MAWDTSVRDHCPVVANGPTVRSRRTITASVPGQQ